MRSILKHFAVFLIWYVGSSAIVGMAFMAKPAMLPAATAPVLVLLLYGALLRGYLLRPRGRHPDAHWATLRARPLRGATLRWTLIAMPVLLTLFWALQQVYLRVVPVPPESFTPFQPVTASATGRLTLALMAIGIAPMLEELVFRGLIQRGLERRWGAAGGMLGAAALFAGMHALPWIFPLHFFLGLAFGFAVYASRSIWSGVLLHAANNTVALLGMLLGGDPPSPTPTLWEAGLDARWWSALVLLMVTAGLAAWTGRRLWEAGREVRLQYA